METTDNFFGINLRRLIKERNISYGAAAGKIEISLSYLNQLMNGEHSPSLKTIEQICSGIGIKPYELFLRTDDIPPTNILSQLADITEALAKAPDKISGVMLYLGLTAAQTKKKKA